VSPQVPHARRSLAPPPRQLISRNLRRSRKRRDPKASLQTTKPSSRRDSHLRSELLQPKCFRFLQAAINARKRRRSASGRRSSLRVTREESTPPLRYPAMGPNESTRHPSARRSDSQPPAWKRAGETCRSAATFSPQAALYCCGAAGSLSVARHIQRRAAIVALKERRDALRCRRSFPSNVAAPGETVSSSKSPATRRR